MTLLIELNPGNIGLYLEQLLAIENAAFAMPWSREDYLAEAERPIAHLLAAVEDGRLLGYAGFWHVLDEADINNVAVAEERRGRGIGRSLVLAVLDMARLLGCREVNLEVRVGNTPAIALYERCGFAPCGRRPKYYSDNDEDAVLMKCLLENGRI